MPLLGIGDLTATRGVPLAHPPRPERTARDVVFAFFGGSWASSLERSQVMPEDRAADALMRHHDVERLIVCNPYRSFGGKARSYVRRRREAEFPASATRHLYAPLRWRRTDPIDPVSWVARYETGLRRHALRLGLERPAVISAHPLLAGLGRFEWAGPVTYYAWDDWTASAPHRRWWDAYDHAFLGLRAARRRACAVSEGILRRVAPTGPHAVIPNGVDPEEWVAPGPSPDWFRSLPRPRLAYVGTLDARVDVGQVEAVAAAFPEGSLTLIGPMLEPSAFAALRRIRNVTIRPWAGRAEVTGLVSDADACLIPHVRNDFTRSMSPLKLFEYLAGGRPVAAVDLPPIASVAAPRLVLVRAGEDFVDGVRRALEIGPASEAERLAFIADNSWTSRFERLLDLALPD